MSDLLSTALLGLGTLVLVVAGGGVALPRSALVRLHYLGLATMCGAPLVLLGVLVRDPGDWFKLLTILVVLVVTSPAATAATARALSRGQAAESSPGATS